MSWIERLQGDSSGHSAHDFASWFKPQERSAAGHDEAVYPHSRNVFRHRTTERQGLREVRIFFFDKMI